LIVQTSNSGGSDDTISGLQGERGREVEGEEKEGERWKERREEGKRSGRKVRGNKDRKKGEENVEIEWKMKREREWQGRMIEKVGRKI
jgi:hypothetical protein